MAKERRIKRFGIVPSIRRSESCARWRHPLNQVFCGAHEGRTRHASTPNRTTPPGVPGHCHDTAAGRGAERANQPIRRDVGRLPGSARAQIAALWADWASSNSPTIRDNDHDADPVRRTRRRSRRYGPRATASGCALCLAAHTPGSCGRSGRSSRPASRRRTPARRSVGGADAVGIRSGQERLHTCVKHVGSPARQVKHSGGRADRRSTNGRESPHPIRCLATHVDEDGDHTPVVWTARGSRWWANNTKDTRLGRRRLERSEGCQETLRGAELPAPPTVCYGLCRTSTPTRSDPSKAVLTRCLVEVQQGGERFVVNACRGSPRGPDRLGGLGSVVQSA